VPWAMQRDPLLFGPGVKGFLCLDHEILQLLLPLRFNPVLHAQNVLLGYRIILQNPFIPATSPPTLCSASLIIPPQKNQHPRLAAPISPDARRLGRRGPIAAPPHQCPISRPPHHRKKLKIFLRIFPPPDA
jgi:hypothetical protein